MLARVLHQPGKEKKLELLVTKLINNKNYIHNFGKNGRNLVIEKFSQKKVINFFCDYVSEIYKSFQKENFFNCKRDDSALKEIKTVINKRIGVPFYVPIISLLCSFLIVHNKTKKSYFFNKYNIFFLSF